MIGPVLQHSQITLWCRITCLLIIVSMVTLTDACFIRNCPLGGKRSHDRIQSEWSSKRQCMPCGPQGLGQCIGPNICCGPDIGCYMSTSETEVCKKEDQNPIPCDITGEVCRSTGRCVSEGICCTDEKCTLDAMCDEPASRDYTLSHDVMKGKMASPQLLKQLDNSPSLESYIRRLLRIRELRNQ